MNRRQLSISLVCVALVSVSVAFADTKPTLEGITCLLQGNKPASESKAAEWKKGKVYFCCDNCVKAFTADKDKHATKANVQLVKTKQYKQEACPISGGKLDESKSIEVSGTKVAFCCDNCKGKVEGMKGDDQVAAVFGEEAFKKAKFDLIKEEKK